MPSFIPNIDIHGGLTFTVILVELGGINRGQEITYQPKYVAWEVRA